MLRCAALYANLCGSVTFQTRVLEQAKAKQQELSEWQECVEEAVSTWNAEARGEIKEYESYLDRVMTNVAVVPGIEVGEALREPQVVIDG